MSRMIKLTPECIKKCREDFEKALSSVTNGKISFTQTLGSVSETAMVYFSERAWYKMQALVCEFDKEVAWHGIAHRGEDFDKNEYYITDIVVYPQEVTGATVEMDTAEYGKWLCDNYEDERFNNIRMQGHSHVNMNTSPSGVDLTHQEEIVKQLTDEMFYIFVIWNKHNSSNIRIFDMKKNILFDDDDISYEVLSDGYGIEDFIKEAKGLVKNKTYKPQAAKDKPEEKEKSGTQAAAKTKIKTTAAKQKKRTKTTDTVYGNSYNLSNTVRYYDGYGYYSDWM